MSASPEMPAALATGRLEAHCSGGEGGEFPGYPEQEMSCDVRNYTDIMRYGTLACHPQAGRLGGWEETYCHHYITTAGVYFPLQVPVYYLMLAQENSELAISRVLGCCMGCGSPWDMG